MIVTYSPKAKEINKMACYYYPSEFLFVTNTLIASNLALFDLMQYSHSCSLKSLFYYHI